MKPTYHHSYAVVFALSLLLGLTGSARATPGQAKPTHYDGGVYVVPIESYNPLKSALNDGSNISNGTSSYADTTVEGITWPLYSSGLLIETSGGSPVAAHGFYNKGDWSQPGSGSTARAALLKSKSLSVPTVLHIPLEAPPPALVPSLGVIATKVTAIVMAVNALEPNNGKTIGKIIVHQVKNGQPVDRELDLVLGNNIRHFKTSTTFCEGLSPCVGVAATTSAPNAKQLYGKPCATNPNELCFIDAVTIDIPADDVQYPITGVTVESYRHGHYIPSLNYTVLGGLRLHGITLHSDFEVKNGATKPTVMSQTSCPHGGERYGGRTVDGQVYGPTRDLSSYGCALTAGTIAGNFHTNQSLSPGDVNTALQKSRGYFPSPDAGVTVGFSSSWQFSCQKLSIDKKSINFDACSCCSLTDDCDQVCSGSAPAYGDLEEVVNACCALKEVPNLPNGSTDVGDTVEVSHRTEYIPAMWSFQPTSAQCGEASKPAQPAIIVDGKPLMALEIMPEPHPLSGQNCEPFTNPALANFFRDPQTQLPCFPNLLLAKIIAINANHPKSFEANQSVGFFGELSFEALSRHYGLSLSQTRLTDDPDDRRAGARQLERLLATGHAPVLHAKGAGVEIDGQPAAGKHFVVATGMKAKAMNGPDIEGGVEVTTNKGLVGTYRVADPGLTSATDLVASFDNSAERKKYRNLYWGWRSMSTVPPLGSTLSIQIYSPADFVLTGPKGQKVGKQLSGDVPSTFENHAFYAPVANYASPEQQSVPVSHSKEAYLHGFDTGVYQIAVVGTGFGPYELRVTVIHPDGSTEEQWTQGLVKPGTVDLFEATLSNDGSMPLSVVTKMPVDGDKDGYPAPADCDDADPSRTPFIAESCFDKIDNDCNGLIDEFDPQCDPNAPACPDNDKDGFADCLVPGCSVKGLACGDCDDNAPTINPKGLEGPSHGMSCLDLLDNDCDGVIDSQLAACAAVAPPAAGIPDWDAPKPPTTAGSGGTGGAGAGGGESTGSGSGGAEATSGGANADAQGETSSESGCQLVSGKLPMSQSMWFALASLALLIRRRRG